MGRATEFLVERERSPGRRIRLAVLLKAVGVLVRRHPAAALDMAGAGLVEAGRSSFLELRRAAPEMPKLLSGKRKKKKARLNRVRSRDLRKLMRALKAESGRAES